MTENQAEVQPQPLPIEELIQSNDIVQVEAVFNELPPVEMARMISSLNKDDHIHLFKILGPEKSAHIISKISGLGAADMVAELTTEKAALVVTELPYPLQVNILRGMKKDRTDEILHAIKPHKVKKLERLMGYAENTADGLMITEYLCFSHASKYSWIATGF